MNNSEMRKHIVDGFDRIAPDVFEEIKSSIEGQQAEGADEVRTMPQVKSAGKGKDKVRRGARFTVRKAVAAACALIVAAGGAGVYLNTAPDSYAAEIYIDANPSLVMEVNEDNQVTKIRAASDNQQTFARELTSTAVYPISVESAVSMAIDELSSEGYISDDRMDLVISYCYRAAGNDEVKEEIERAARQSMARDSYIIQEFRDTDELEEKAHDNNISPGKCYYIESLAQNHDLTVEKCADKSIAQIQAEADSEDAEKAAAQKESINKGSASGSTISSQTKGLSETKASQAADTTKHTQKQSVKQSSQKQGGHKQPASKPASGKDKASATASASSGNTSVQPSKTAARASIVGAACSTNGIIRVHFDRRVKFSQTLQIIVTDSEGEIIRSRVVAKRSTFIKIRAYDVAEGSTYSVTIAGVRSESSEKYRSETTTVTVKSYSKAATAE